MSSALSPNDRLQLLENAQRYYSAAYKFIRTCSHLAPATILVVPDLQNDIGTWQGEVFFTSGHVLKFRDVYRRHEDGLLERTVNYDFRVLHSEDVCFRVDAHGYPVIGDGELHVDLPNKKVVTESDLQAKGHTLAYFTMIDMIYLICLHVEGNKLPWE